MLDWRVRRFVPCLAAIFPVFSWGQFSYTTLASGLSRPVAVIQPPGDARLFVVEQRNGTTGRIRVYKNGALLATPYLSIPNVSVDQEQGLLGLAFDPNFQTNFRFYVNYTNAAGDTVVARYSASSATTDVANTTPTAILTIDQPDTNHNGGSLVFGADGYLYIGMGDGGSQNDPGNRAQNTSNLLGKILRIDVTGDDFPADPAKNYRIPPTNPFAGATPGADEVWSYGWRNPWKWAFDRRLLGGFGGLTVADVGQDTWEEIDYEHENRPGLNYGWRVREGLVETGFGGGSGPFTDPIWVYAHNPGCSITGGVLYRGSRLGIANYGRYFFSDFCYSRLMSVRVDIDPLTGVATASDFQDHFTLGANVSSIHADNNGELYFTTVGGSFRRLNFAPGGFAIQGQINWQDLEATAKRPDHIDVEYRAHGSLVPLYTLSIGLQQNGTFRLPCPTGNIDVSIKGPHWLRRTLNVNATAGDVTGLVFNMVNGDADGDNEVGIGDYAVISSAYGTSLGDPSWDPNADLNGDESVDIADYAILSSRYGQIGND